MLFLYFYHKTIILSVCLLDAILKCQMSEPNSSITEYRVEEGVRVYRWSMERKLYFTKSYFTLLFLYK